jgi:hypothetical protein
VQVGLEGVEPQAAAADVEHARLCRDARQGEDAGVVADTGAAREPAHRGVAAARGGVDIHVASM